MTIKYFKRRHQQDIWVLSFDSAGKPWHGYSLSSSNQLEAPCWPDDFKEVHFDFNSELSLMKYRDGQGVQYTEPDHIGGMSIQVLPFLYGVELNDMVFGYIHALRPSYVRVVESGQSVTADSIPWRVTIVINSDHTIMEITQEVDVGLYGGTKSGYDLFQLIPPNK